MLKLTLQESNRAGTPISLNPPLSYSSPAGLSADTWLATVASALQIVSMHPCSKHKPMAYFTQLLKSKLF